MSKSNVVWWFNSELPSCAKLVQIMLLCLDENIQCRQCFCLRPTYGQADLGMVRVVLLLGDTLLDLFHSILYPPLPFGLNEAFEEMSLSIKSFQKLFSPFEIGRCCLPANVWWKYFFMLVLKSGLTLAFSCKHQLDVAK